MIFWLAELQSATNPAFAESLLTSEETLVFTRLSGERRRAEWLMGRSLAKQLVQRYCEVSELEIPDRRAIGILPSASGAPVVHIDGTPQALALSISHSHAAGFVALTSAPGLHIGADIERLAERDERFQQDFFTETERENIQSASPQDKTALITAIWSGKEAYYKATGGGLPLRTQALEIVPQAMPGDEWSPFVLNNAAEGEWEGSWRVWGEYVLAVVTG